MAMSETITYSKTELVQLPQAKSEHIPSKAKAPIIIRPDDPPPGLKGLMQACAGFLFLFLTGSCFYIVIAVALYIMIGFGILGHRVGPTIWMGIWIAQGLVPVASFRQWPKAMRRYWLLREVARYFDHTLILEQRLDTSRRYMFAQHPHGTIPVAAFLSAYFVHDTVPGKRIFCLIHNGIFHLPIVRLIVGYLGCVSATKESIAKVRDELDENCCIVVGGVREIFLTDEAHERVLMRTGFVREAIKNGFDLVPMYHYNNSRIYRFLGPASLWAALSSCLPFPFFIVVGRWFTPMPRRVPITTVVGTPLGVHKILGIKDGERVADPTPEQIKAVYDRFVDELVAMYKRHRPPTEQRDLLIVEK